MKRLRAEATLIQIVPAAACMDERVNMLCRRIELYRNYLQQGVDAALAATYLREISRAGMSLAFLAGDNATLSAIVAATAIRRAAAPARLLTARGIRHASTRSPRRSRRCD